MRRRLLQALPVALPGNLEITYVREILRNVFCYSCAWKGYGIEMRRQRSLPLMRDIATATGYSLSTVSRALNNKQDINEETRRRILLVAEELGYLPDGVAIALAGGKTNAIGVVVSDISDPYFGELVKYIESEASRYDYRIILCNTSEKPEIQQQAIEVLIGKRVDGIIITPAEGTSEDIAGLLNIGIPVVLAARRIDNLDVTFVTVDDEYAGELIGKYLAELGHETVAYLDVGINISSARGRRQGLSRGFLNAVSTGTLAIEKVGLPSIEGGYMATRQLLSREDFDASAIVAYCDVMAIGCLRALGEQGIRVPSEIAVVGNDDVEVCQYMNPAITTVDGCKETIAAKCVDVLIDQINQDGCFGTEQHVLRPTIIARESTGHKLSCTLNRRCQ
jgi:LacI family transcriptional regulator